MRGQRLQLQIVVTRLVFIVGSCRRAGSSSALAFLLPHSINSPLSRPDVSPISRCTVHSSIPLISDAVESSATRQTEKFFEQQLDVCKKIAVDRLDYDLPLKRLGGSKDRGDRKRFKEHPRCTARFGEVLLHARDGAASSEEYRNAVHNARSIVNYVNACRGRSDDDSCLIRDGLIADIADTLTSESIRKFRVRQIEDVAEDVSSRADFTLEQADLVILGRLYYSAIRRNEGYLREVGLTLDHAGFTALLALCRAASDSSSMAELSKDGAKLDAALSDHFNGITTPGCRFSFSRRHGIKNTNSAVVRSKRLIVAFSSLGNGLVRHEFGGSLAKINSQLHSDGLDTFDVLFVADPSQSWYQKGSRGSFDGFEEYERRIRSASRPYSQICLVGDSMGGSGALLFSHLAIDSVVAFSPQINLGGDIHVSRYDMTTGIRDQYYKRLLWSVEEAVASGVNIFVHRGVEDADVRHTDQLVNHFSEKVSEGLGPMTGHLQIIEHPDCKHHQVASYLKKKGCLAQVIYSNLIE